MMEVLRENGDKWAEPWSVEDRMIKWRQEEELRRGIHQKYKVNLFLVCQYYFLYLITIVTFFSFW